MRRGRWAPRGHLLLPLLQLPEPTELGRCLKLVGVPLLAVALVRRQGGVRREVAVGSDQSRPGPGRVAVGGELAR